MPFSEKTIEMDTVFESPELEEYLCIIIPAHNEESYIGSCLDALLHQDGTAGPVAIIVVANACTDRTEEIVRNHEARFAARGWQLDLLSTKIPGKLNALNQAETLTTSKMRVYLDADVSCDPDLLGQLRNALDTSEPVYATGTLRVMPAKSWISRAYAALWIKLPFVKDGAAGVGLFSVNAAGRERWGEFPSIISDDTFVRLNFLPRERIEVAARYHWPMVEGFRNLVKVRRRQDAGVTQIAYLYPALEQNDSKRQLSIFDTLKLFLENPVNFIIYAAVQLTVRLHEGGEEWTRGR